MLFNIQCYYNIHDVFGAFNNIFLTLYLTIYIFFMLPFACLTPL